MKKVDSNNGVWVNDDPATLTNGTPIDADVMNNIQDEISNVITDNGGTLDGTNHSQLSQTLDKTFAKLNSPTLTGVPLTSNPDGTINNQIATVDYVNQKALQATVGFTPTQQGGGTDQGANKIYIGGDSTDATQVRVQVDQTDLGRLVFQDNDAYTHGVDQIGFNIGGQTFAFRDASDKSWRFLYTTSQIDEKSYISSLPTGDNTKVTDIIWNTSSNLPAYYYGADNQVSYSATTDWVNGNFATQTLLNNETNARTAADQTLQTNINNEATTRATAITNLQNTKQNNLGFEPVQQGGGANQLGNKVYLGWDGSGLRCQVDSSDLGQLARVSQLPISPSDKILRFTVSNVVYRQTISYPEAFSSGDVILSMTAQAVDDNVRGLLICNYESNSKTPTGFNIRVEYTNGYGNQSLPASDPATIDIIAIGPK